MSQDHFACDDFNFLHAGRHPSKEENRPNVPSQACLGIPKFDWKP